MQDSLINAECYCIGTYNQVKLQHCDNIIHNRITRVYIIILLVWFVADSSVGTERKMEVGTRLLSS